MIEFDNRYSISIINRSRCSVPAELFVWWEAPENPDLVLLVLRHSGGEIRQAGEKVFYVLCEIRRLLEAEDKLLWCYGASKNVYPSPMSLDMGGGGIACRMEIGRPAQATDTVVIFDAGDDVVPATVDEQYEFYLSWLDSLNG